MYDKYIDNTFTQRNITQYIYTVKRLHRGGHPQPQIDPKCIKMAEAALKGLLIDLLSFYTQTHYESYS